MYLRYFLTLKMTSKFNVLLENTDNGSEGMSELKQYIIFCRQMERNRGKQGSKEERKTKEERMFERDGKRNIEIENGF